MWLNNMQRLTRHALTVRKRNLRRLHALRRAVKTDTLRRRLARRRNMRDLVSSCVAMTGHVERTTIDFDRDWLLTWYTVTDWQTACLSCRRLDSLTFVDEDDDAAAAALNHRSVNSADLSHTNWSIFWSVGNQSATPDANASCQWRTKGGGGSCCNCPPLSPRESDQKFWSTICMAILQEKFSKFAAIIVNQNDVVAGYVAFQKLKMHKIARTFFSEAYNAPETRR